MELKGTFGALEARYYDPTTPAHYDPAWGAWAVFSAADVLRIFENSGGAFSKDFRPAADAHPTELFMWATDGKRHTDFQELLREPLHRHWQALETRGRIAELAEEYLDQALAEGPSDHVELMRGFAHPFAFAVACELMGVSRDRVDQHLDFLDHYLWPEGVSKIDRQANVVVYFRSLLEERKQWRGQGLLDTLIEAWQQGYPLAGEPLGERDLIATLWAILVDTADAVGTSVGNAVLALSAWGCWEQLRAQRGLLATALPETMRWNPAFPVEWVRACRTVRFGECEIPASSIVMGWISTANRDPVLFPDPDTFLPDRTPNPHLSFGRGPHTCLGARLAQAEMSHALSALLDRCVEVVPDVERPPEYRFRANNSLIRAYVRFR